VSWAWANLGEPLTNIAANIAKYFVRSALFFALASILALSFFG
jgi:hypothetical protein